MRPGKPLECMYRSRRILDIAPEGHYYRKKTTNGKRGPPRELFLSLAVKKEYPKDAPRLDLHGLMVEIIEEMEYKGFPMKRARFGLIRGPRTSNQEWPEMQRQKAEESNASSIDGAKPTTHRRSADDAELQPQVQQTMGHVDLHSLPSTKGAATAAAAVAAPANGDGAAASLTPCGSAVVTAMLNKCDDDLLRPRLEFDSTPSYYEEELCNNPSILFSFHVFHFFVGALINSSFIRYRLKVCSVVFVCRIVIFIHVFGLQQSQVFKLSKELLSNENHHLVSEISAKAGRLPTKRKRSPE